MTPIQAPSRTVINLTELADEQTYYEPRAALSGALRSQRRKCALEGGHPPGCRPLTFTNGGHSDERNNGPG